MDAGGFTGEVRAIASTATSMPASSSSSSSG